MSRTKKEPKESPSKKLRNIFYILWEKDDEGFDTFDLYYESKMTKLVNYYKKLI